VSLARVSGGRCRFVRGGGTLAPRRSCSKAGYLPARLGRLRAGKVPWTLRVKRGLPPGRYVARVVAYDADGRASPPSRRSVKRFAVR
jgi:hypothetical protein